MGQRERRGLLGMGVVVLAALYIGQDVFLPVVLAILLAFVLAPFVEILRRWRLGRRGCLGRCVR